MNLILKAVTFAKFCHTGQVRKFSNAVPYIVHPCRVATKVMLLDEATEDMVCAAYLHDTAEDCNVPISMLRADFNHPIAELVEELTNVSKITHPKADRAERKQLDLDRIKGVSREAKLIKLCDRIDNLRDIPLTEDFAPKYAAESKELLEVLRGTHQGLEAEYEEVLSWF